MNRTRKISILLFILSIISFLTAVATGVIPLRARFFVFLSALVVLAAANLSFSGKKKLQLIAYNISLTFILVLFPFSIADLYLRPEVTVNKYPKFPKVLRFTPNASTSVLTFGDLAELSGKREVRQMRTIKRSTDSFGFLNEIDYPVTKAEVEVVILTDSYGSEAVSQEKLWPSLLQEVYGFKTCNLSIPKSNPWQEFVHLAEVLPELNSSEQTIVVWGLFSGNDLDERGYGPLDPASIEASSPLMRFRVWAANVRDNSLIGNLILKTLSLKTFKPELVIEKTHPELGEVLFLRHYVHVRDRSYDEVLSHKQYLNFSKTIEAVKKQTDAYGVDLHIVCIPSKAEIYSWILDSSDPLAPDTTQSGFCKALAEISRENEIDFHDLKPDLVKYSKELYLETGELLWWHDDTHWNERGNKFVASVIASYLGK